MKLGESMNRGTCNFFGLHTNVKFKAIFKINIIKFLIIYVVIDFNGNHHNFILMNSKKIIFEMTTLHLSHRKNENFGLKKYVKIVSK